jgi:hypothetical protein
MRPLRYLWPASTATSRSRRWSGRYTLSPLPVRAQSASRVLEAALSLPGSESTTHRLVRANRLEGFAPAPDTVAWPWHIRVFTLGRFSVVVNGEAVRFAAKTQGDPWSCSRHWSRSAGVRFANGVSRTRSGRTPKGMQPSGHSARRCIGSGHCWATSTPSRGEPERSPWTRSASGSTCGLRTWTVPHRSAARRAEAASAGRAAPTVSAVRHGQLPQNSHVQSASTLWMRPSDSKDKLRISRTTRVSVQPTRSGLPRPQRDS